MGFDKDQRNVGLLGNFHDVQIFDKYYRGFQNPAQITSLVDFSHRRVEIYNR